ncbi:MAG: hypothetical protein Q9170_003696 [Blastenia crenularia]
MSQKTVNETGTQPNSHANGRNDANLALSALTGQDESTQEAKTRYWEELAAYPTIVDIVPKSGYEELSGEAQNHVNKVDLTFTIRDLSNDLTCCLPPDQPSWEWPYYESEAERSEDFRQAFESTSKSEWGTGSSEQVPTTDLVDKYHKCDQQKDQSDNEQGIWPANRAFTGRIDADAVERERQDDELLTFELKSIWVDKIYNIRYLPLTELSLDFFECYGTDQQWMGFEVAAAFPAFYHGLPQILRIYAPDQTMRDELERLIQERNA